ncbi:MAG TPA: hypothetical protein VEG26_09675 [Steroidobacteraceae bacterium]|nr:hypothetical protein [Steroidobacteraceae bacterium]
MSLAVQGVLVGVVVVACVIYSAWRLASLKFRLRLIDALGALPPVLTARWLAALRQRTLAQLAGGCAGCAAGGGLTQDAAARPNQTPGALRR